MFFTLVDRIRSQLVVLITGLVFILIGSNPLSVLAQSSVIEFDKDWQENLQTFQKTYQSSQQVISGLNQEIENLNSRFKNESNPIKKETLRRELNEALSSLGLVLIGTFGQLDSLRSQVLNAGDHALRHLDRDNQSNMKEIVEIERQLHEIDQVIADVNSQFQVLESITVKYAGSTRISLAADELKRLQAQVMQGHLSDLPAQQQHLEEIYNRLIAGTGHNSAVLEKILTDFRYQTSWIPIKKQIYELWARLGFMSTKTQLVLDDIFAPLLEMQGFEDFGKLTSISDGLIFKPMDDSGSTMLPTIGFSEQCYNNQRRDEGFNGSPLLVLPATMNQENGVDLSNASNRRN